MFTVSNQLAEFQQTVIDSFARFAKVQLESTKRLAELNFATAREWAEESVKNTQSLSTAKDVKGAIDLQSAIAKPAANRTLVYAHGVYDIFTKANNELKEISEAQVAEINKQLAGTLDNVAQNAPAGSEPAVAFVKSSVSAATNAFDQATKFNKQLFAATEANLAAALAAIERPVAAAQQ